MTKAMMARIGQRFRRPDFWCVAMTFAEIEGFKHRASWMNSLATAVATTGILAPMLAVLTGALPGGPNVGVLIIINGICVIVSMALHFQDWVILSELEQ